MKLQAGGEVADCHKAPSPILPAKNEIIWGVISFVVLAAVLMKFAVPAMQKGMAARTERVRSDLGAAEKAKADADTMLADYRAQLADARNESNRMIEEARRSADALRADLQSRAQSEIAELRALRAADVEAAKVSAIADLRAEVASLAIGAAETIVQKSLDRDPRCSSSRTTSTRSGAGSKWPTIASTHTRMPSSESPRPRVDSTTSKTSCSASPASSTDQ